MKPLPKLKLPKLRISDRLGVLIDPRFWLRNFPVDHGWSDDLDALLKRGVLAYRRTDTNRRNTARIGERDVWVSNWPYAYGREWGINRKSLPRRATALRMRQAMRESLGLDEGLEEPLNLPPPKCK